MGGRCCARRSAGAGVWPPSPVRALASPSEPPRPSPSNLFGAGPACMPRPFVTLSRGERRATLEAQKPSRWWWPRWASPARVCPHHQRRASRRPRPRRTRRRRTPATPAHPAARRPQPRPHRRHHPRRHRPCRPRPRRTRASASDFARTGSPCRTWSSRPANCRPARRHEHHAPTCGRPGTGRRGPPHHPAAATYPNPATRPEQPRPRHPGYLGAHHVGGATGRRPPTWQSSAIFSDEVRRQTWRAVGPVARRRSRLCVVASLVRPCANE